MYNLERQDIGNVLRLVNKIAFWQRKTEDALSDDDLQRLVASRDTINRMLRGTVYEAPNL